MVPYIFLFIIVIFLMITYYFKNNKSMMKFFIFSLFFLFVIMQGFRNVEVGIDTTSYVNYINAQHFFDLSEFLNHRFELFFKILIRFLSNVFSDNHWIFFIISFISAYPLFKTVYKYSKNPFLSLLTYLAFGYYFLNFSLLRQGIAMGLTFYSIEYIEKRDKKKFFLTIFLATLFHSSALFFIPAYFCYNFKLDNKMLCKILAIGAVLFFLKENILVWILQYFFKGYTVSKSDSYLWFLMCLIIWLFCYIISYKKSSNQDKQINLLCNLSLIGVMTMIFTSVSSNALRISNYYYIYIVLLIPNAISTIIKPKDRLLMVVGIIALEFILYYYLLNVDNHSVVPYMFR